MTKGKIMLGILGGVAAGALLGVLMAPNKGERTRRNIKRKGEDLADAVNDKIDQKFEELLDSLTGKVRKSESKITTEGKQSD